VFFGVLVVLLPVLREGPTPQRLRLLEQRFLVSRRTLYRWRLWWRKVVPKSRWWQAARGLLATPISTEALPGSLLTVFSAIEGTGDRICAFLQFLSFDASSLALGI